MKSIVLVSPSVPTMQAGGHSSIALNGNAHTALRWAQMLTELGHSARVVGAWNAHDPPADLMIALHARRSAASIGSWASLHTHKLNPHKPLLVVLTGTDVYRDIHSDAQAQNSLQVATHLAVLQDQAVCELPSRYQLKTHVVVQSAHATPAQQANDGVLRVLMVGHLRGEKDPATFLRAVARLRDQPNMQFTHIGDGLDADLLAHAQQTQSLCPNYHYLGAQTHAQTLAHMAKSHVLVHASVMEGGAHVIAEAVCAGSAVLASRISGNVGMLGQGYAGYFELGNDAELAAALRNCVCEPGKLPTLLQQCEQRRPLFSPQAEQSALNQLIEHCLTESHP